MGRLILEQNSFENLNRLGNINNSINDFIDTITLSLNNKDSHSRLTSLDTHVYNFGNFFYDLIYSPWEDVNANINLNGITQITHQSLSNLFYAYPNGGKSYTTFEEFEADGDQFLGYIGINEFTSVKSPYLNCCLHWLEWRANFFRENQKLIDWSEIKNNYFPNLFYSNFILANEIEAVKIQEKVCNNFAKEYCDNFNQMKLSRGALMALADKLGKSIAEANYYVYDNDLSQLESRLRKSQRKIYSLILVDGTKQYLSIDFHKCFCFEVCDYRGRHIAEYRFDGIENGNNTIDTTGAHDIIALRK